MNTTRLAPSSLARRARADESVARLYLAFVGLVIGAAAVAWLAGSLYRSHVGDHPIDASILLPVYRPLLNPKPVERFTFLLLASLMPVVAFFCALKSRGSPAYSLLYALKATISAAVGVAFFVPFAEFGFDVSLLTGTTPSGAHHFLLLCGVVVVAALTCLPPIKASIRSTRIPSTISGWLLFASSAMLQIAAWRILNVNSITEGNTWWMSMDAVTYSVSQVVGGRTLLADLPSQYGLFPEFVAPVLRFFGLSIFSFSALFAAMQIVSLGTVYWVAQRSLRHPLFKIGFGVALVMITYETCLFLLGIPELYFQYWPVRFFWPAVSVLAFFLYAKKPTIRRAALISLIGSIGSLWNADSGVMVALAFGALLLAKWSALFFRDKQNSSRERRAILLKLWLHIAIFAMVATTAVLYLTLKADRSLHWTWLVGYQRLFYGLGFMMLPLPLRASPWMAVLGVYLLGILTAASTWRHSPRSRSADVLLYTCLLGIGLFVYYEGRSHILNLITVSWPALLAASLMADRLVRATAAGILNRIFVAPAAVAGGVMLLCGLAFAQGIPALASSAKSTIAQWSIPASPVVHDEVAFISSNTKRGDACVILSKRQGLYYASLHLVSPLIGPGYMETLTVADRDAMIAQLNEHKFDCVFVGQGGSTPDLGVDLLSALPSYRVIRSNSLQTMVQLMPK
ncbi:hypothetical protein [Paraburkholderia nodosa]|uniref:hypothetical protein n=1 Tax=Paraburkholderia nodosa TaxID=392320 RepID=UPI000B139217|nr:hypothetical protein [Paraburkholderia nodosa]